MKKFLVLMLCILMGVLCIAGCGAKKEEENQVQENDPQILGTWMEDYWDSGYEFREDGTGSDVFWNQEFTYTAVDGNLEIAYTEGLWAEKKFTYSIFENTLTLNEILPTGSTEEPGRWDYTKR